MTPGFNLYSRHSANVPYILLPVPEAPNSGKHFVYPLDTKENIDLARKTLGESGRLSTAIYQMPLMVFTHRYQKGDPVDCSSSWFSLSSSEFHYRKLAFGWVPTMYEVWVVTEHDWGSATPLHETFYDEREANMFVLENAHKSPSRQFTVEKRYQHRDHPLNPTVRGGIQG